VRLLVLVAIKKHPFLTKVGLITDLKMSQKFNLFMLSAAANQAHEIVAAMKQEIDFWREGIKKRKTFH